MLTFLTHWQQPWIIHVWCVLSLFFYCFPSDGMALPAFLLCPLGAKQTNKHHPISYLLLSFDIQTDFSKWHHIVEFGGLLSWGKCLLLDELFVFMFHPQFPKLSWGFAFHILVYCFVMVLWTWKQLPEIFQSFVFQLFREYNPSWYLVLLDF